MVRVQNYETASKFVKVMLRIVNTVDSFSGRGVYRTAEAISVRLNQIRYRMCDTLNDFSHPPAEHS